MKTHSKIVLPGDSLVPSTDIQETSDLASDRHLCAASLWDLGFWGTVHAAVFADDFLQALSDSLTAAALPDCGGGIALLGNQRQPVWKGQGMGSRPHLLNTAQ